MLTGAKILIVDDDERLCRTLAKYLTREGYSVREALNGDEMRAKLGKAWLRLRVRRLYQQLLALQAFLYLLIFP